MNIKVIYKNSRVEIFDTISFTTPQPFATKNMLTDFELHLDELKEKGLWLYAHYYEIDDEYKKSTDDTETPMAHRKFGWKFLLSQPNELENIIRVDIDDNTVLLRIENELYNFNLFKEKERLLMDNQGGAIYTRILNLYEYYKTSDMNNKCLTDEEAAREIGLSIETIDAMQSKV